MSAPQAPGPQLAGAAGSAKKCQWLVECANWSECGQPATHKHVDSSTYYCVTHADALCAMVGGVHPLVSAHAEKYVIEADGRMRVEWPSPNSGLSDDRHDNQAT